LLYSFKGLPDGAIPVAALLERGGALYGTTVTGGTGRYCSAGPCGTVFKVSPDGAESVVYNFTGGADGAYPRASLIAHDGRLYSTTPDGGYGEGTVFAVTPTGIGYGLYSFGFSSSDGEFPQGALLDLNGTFYGTTAYGGTNIDCGTFSQACGTAFKITTAGAETVLYSFGANASDGQEPYGALVAVKGKLYGTTSEGGVGYGTVFSLTLEGTEHVLHAFGGPPGDGAFPSANLIAVNGTLYGTTYLGGEGVGHGVVFAITPAGEEHVLYSFGNRPGDAAYLSAGLLYADGTLYGTSVGGGVYDNGTIFAMSTSGTMERVLHSFGAGKDGIEPYSALVEVNGTLYGTTSEGGAENNGTVFAFTP
jgi:uncharacterized repeat protein (TIGR03803 family)